MSHNQIDLVVIGGVLVINVILIVIALRIIKKIGDI